MDLDRRMYLNTKEAAEYLAIKGKDPAEAALIWMKRHGVPLSWIGRRRVVLRVSLEEAMKRSRKERDLGSRRLSSPRKTPQLNTTGILPARPQPPLSENPTAVTRLERRLHRILHYSEFTPELVAKLQRLAAMPVFLGAVERLVDEFLKAMRKQEQADLRRAKRQEEANRRRAGVLEDTDAKEGGSGKL